MLRIWLLGVLRLDVDGVQVAPPSSRRAQLLLGMLALDRRPQARATLAARLWPDVLDKSARASLRTALTQLRGTLGSNAGRFLHATHEHVALAGPEDVWVDVEEFERLLVKRELQSALALWGELLAGLEEEWVYAQRDDLRQRLSEALGLAANEADASGDVQTALLWTRRQVALDPLAEEPQRDLIRRLASMNDRAAALTVYDKFATRLREQLGTAPSAATRELAAAVRAGAALAERGTAQSGLEHDGVVTAYAGNSVDPAVVGLTLPQPLQSVVTFPSAFVGREDELACLHERWRHVCGGARVTVIVGGEAGIGKTRLAAELAHGAHEQGGLVLYGRCDEGLAVPYQPFVEALRPYAHAVGLTRLRAELGYLAPELGRLWPELAGLGEPVRGDPESERFALLEAVAALLEAATREQPALMILDDLHWAARPTLLLLRHLIRCERRLEVLLIGTYRETELDPDQPLAQLLADLQRDASAQRLHIGGLDRTAIAALLETTIGHPLDEPAAQLVQLLEDQTAGNPFFLRELLAHLTESGAHPEPPKMEISEGLRDVIAQRIARLTAPARRALSVAAVAGPTFSLVLLERVLGERSEMPDALDEAVAAGLLMETGHAEYVFAHALVRQAIYGQMGSARRMRLHRQLGEALETLDDAEARVEALAHHFAQAAADGQTIKATTYALAAGRSAITRLGYEEAAAHYQRGLQALTLTNKPDEKRHCELLLALGEARWGAGDLDKARQTYAEAAELADSLGDATALARAALGFFGPHRFGAGEMEAKMTTATRPVASLLERALTTLGYDSPLRAQLMGRLAAALTYTEVEYRKPMLARRALKMARRATDKATLADVLASSIWATNGPDTLHESISMAEELGQLADEIGDRILRALAHTWLLDFMLELGDIEAVDREIEALQRLAQQRKERYFSWLLTVFRASYIQLQGRLEDCEMLAHEALAHRFEGNDEIAAQTLGVQLLYVRRDQGRLDEIVHAVEGFVEQYPQLTAWRSALAYVYALLGRTVATRQEFETLSHADFSGLPHDKYWLASVAALAEVAVSLDDVPRARVLYKLLLPYADRCVVAVALLCVGSASRPLGLLATTLSHYDDAERHYEQALDMNAQIRSPLWIAYTQHDYARMLLLRNRPGDNDKALQLLRQALATAEQLGLKTLTGQARPLKLIVEALRSPR